MYTNVWAPGLVNPFPIDPPDPVDPIDPVDPTAIKQTCTTFRGLNYNEFAEELPRPVLGAADFPAWYQITYV
jgi:hypothetical protein